MAITQTVTGTCVHYWLLASPAGGSSTVEAHCRLCGVKREYETAWKGTDWNGESQARGHEGDEPAGTHPDLTD